MSYIDLSFKAFLHSGFIKAKLHIFLLKNYEDYGVVRNSHLQRVVACNYISWAFDKYVISRQKSFGMQPRANETP